MKKRDDIAPWLIPIIEKKLEKYRKMSFAELQKVKPKLLHDRHGTPGHKDFYQYEIEIFYNGGPRPFFPRNIRIVGSIDDGSEYLSRHPISRDFIKTPQNTFIGE